ncbi:hypothetical protein Ahy_A06g027956 isoform A [Arachis hypogaea]|uniref:At2g35280-like TPR domain-containing protein n=1 Tax=Arachis hypogaea TaxID=3818 RepID=A0A445CQ56_ARAHY|nr:hypothetical protein Ahy_A06g027956 isoform A [Arachis hypogaea]
MVRGVQMMEGFLMKKGRQRVERRSYGKEELKKGYYLQMAGGSMKNGRKKKAAKKVRDKGTVSVEYECPLNLLPRDIWVRIATRVSCKVFLGAARSDTIYKEVSMMELPIVSFLDNYGLPKHRFIERCAEAGNPGAMLRAEMTEFSLFGDCVGVTGDELEGYYMCAMLLLSIAIEDEELMRKGLKFFEIVRASGALERCRGVFNHLFAGPRLELMPLYTGLPKVYRSTSCRTRGIMGDVKDLSWVSCVQCLADYEVQGLTEYFWIARRGIGMELLCKAWTEGSVEAGYLSAMLLLCDNENKEKMQRGVEMSESIHTSKETLKSAGSSLRTFSRSDRLTRSGFSWRC